MSLPAEILLGSGLALICALVHVGVIIGGVGLLRRMVGRRGVRLLGIGVLIALVAHIVQIWAWAAAFQFFGAFDDFAASFYFSIATYTTVGYGDVVLAPGIRVFAAFASVTGMLAFGISTAFLASLITRLVPSHWRDP